MFVSFAMNLTAPSGLGPCITHWKSNIDELCKHLKTHEVHKIRLSYVESLFLEQLAILETEVNGIFGDLNKSLMEF
jgi:hypothetical protein